MTVSGCRVGEYIHDSIAYIVSHVCSLYLHEYGLTILKSHGCSECCINR